MTKNKQKEDPKARKMLEVELDLDTNKLYDDLPKAIAYLQQIASQHSDKPDLHIEEKWIGYEDMYLRFTYHRLETDEEYNSRMEIEEAEARRHSEMLREAARKKKIQEEIERLKRQL